MLNPRQWLDEDESWRERLLQLPHELGPAGLLARAALGWGGVVLWRARRG